ncbi:vacuolar protein sorting-associated protein 35 [Gonapodya prolifera JEL478]|uniref:Vacuolar protein sorting-associated protein 35 n=1 Tax=Gonapodya prolifera (strain JEL478) TaxID=1344416 RepID=A0A139AHL1_GONPJ|nr:vacuolar protein sorting-associated protein 35 [Gonapodya prolifera JEL478]|eukprot:KXS16312.1 vacuolar protein sorting-associated protein 35 [Gonapodya prolifera JEL478]
MKKCLEGNRLMDALKHCSTMLNELRTAALTPKNYYELYMAVFDEMRHLTAFLYDAHLQKRHHLSDLYELVQYAGNIIPRLYLMITVGSVYMRVSKQFLPQSAAARVEPTASVTEEVPSGQPNPSTDRWEEDVPPIKELMRDMLEMSRGVQHPTRGLFLRFYLQQMTRDFLPDGKVEGPHGTLNDSITFILQNFMEMNKLWVRLQYQGPTREREKREQERKELRQLVGSNIVRVSQLDGVDLSVYKGLILPSILDEVVSCKDVIAQEYLMEVIIQVFSDEFHIRTLDPFLSAVAQLARQVDVKQIVISLLDRFAAYASRTREEEQEARKEALRQASEDAQAVASLQEKFAQTPPTGIPLDVPLFDIFWNQIAELIKGRPEFTISDVVALLQGLLGLTLGCYPEKLDNVDRVIALAGDAVKAAIGVSSPDLVSDNYVNLISSFLASPILQYQSNLLVLLQFPSSSSHQATRTGPLGGSYTQLLSMQAFFLRRRVGAQIADTLGRNGILIDTKDGVDIVFGELLNALVQDQRDGGLFGEVVENGAVPTPGRGTVDWEDITEEQAKVARVVQLVRVSDPTATVKGAADSEFTLLKHLRDHLNASGDVRVRFTVPALVTSLFKLIRKYKSLDLTDESVHAQIGLVLEFLDGTVSSLLRCREYLVDDDAPTAPRGLGDGLMSPSDQALRLFLQSATAAGEVSFEEQTFEFFTQALTVFEDSIADSRQQFAVLTLLTATLQRNTVLTQDHYSTIAAKITVHFSRLLRRTDQCRGLLIASHLYWDNPGWPQDSGRRSAEVVDRAREIAVGLKDPGLTAGLLVEVLEKVVWYFAKGNETISAPSVSALIEHIANLLSSLEAASSAPSTPPGAFDRPRSRVPEQAVRHFRNVLSLIGTRRDEAIKARGSGVGEMTVGGGRFADVIVR